MTDAARTTTISPALHHCATLLLLTLVGCSYERSVEPATDPAAPPFEMRALNEGPAIHYVGSVAPVYVAVLDKNGVGVRGVDVTFDVTSGGGFISGRTAVTGADGIATTRGWTLGATPGANTLVASVPGLPPLTFQRTTIVAQPSGCSDGTHLLATTTVATLDFTDCLSDGVYTDEFALTLDQSDAYLFTQSSTAFHTWLALYSAGRRIAESSDTSTNAPTSSAIKALLPAGQYSLLASSWTWYSMGAYTLSSSRTSSEATGCQEVFVVFGVSTAQHIESTDCPPAGGRGHADRFSIYLAPGESMTVTMTSQAIDPYLEIVMVDRFTSEHVSIASNDNAASGTTSARVVIPAAQSGYYIIYARTAADGQVGAYTLDVTP